MKINPFGTGTRDGVTVRDVPGRTDVSRQENSFQSQLRQVYKGGWQEQLTKLLDEIDGAANQLSKEKTIPSLRNYKEKVRSFIRAVTERAYELREEYGWDRRGGQKVFMLVRRIDEQLEQLTADIMDEQQEGMNLLNRLDEVRGILMDILA